MQEPDGRESSWGAEKWTNNSVDLQSHTQKGNEVPIFATNRWIVLDSDSSSSFSMTLVRNEDSEDKPRTPVVSTFEMGNSSSVLPMQQQGAEGDVDVVDDWEKAYD